MTSFDQELIQEFIAECVDMIDEIEPMLLSASLLDVEMANGLFRPVHSIKGSSASLGFSNIANSVHVAEEILSYIRSAGVSGDSTFLAFFLRLFDFIRKGFEVIAVEGSDDACAQESAKLNEEAVNLKGVLEGKAPSAKAPAAAKIPEEVEEVVTAEEEASLDVAVEEVAILLDQPEARNEVEDFDDIGIELSQDMIESFVAESNESINIVEESILALMKDTGQLSALEEAFRRVHSFKGNCGIFSLKDLEVLSHRMESIFEMVINNELEANQGTYEVLLPLMDILRDGVSSLSTGGKAEVPGLDLYMEILEGVIKKGGAATAGAETKETAVAPVEQEKDSDIKTENKIEDNAEKAEITPAKKVIASSLKKDTDEKVLSAVKRQDIRVDVAKLDMLNNLVGELVTAKTMIAENFRLLEISGEKAEKDLRFLDRIANELQDVAMSVRMIPISGLFKRMIRIVHDISSKLEKKINFTFYGEETEVDKTVIEKITDPLVHMIRNAVDHGVEDSATRKSVGKEPVGKVTLSAKNEAGEIWIIIQDDGKGLKRDLILNKAIKHGIVTGDGSELTDSEVFKFIFHPGFSTAEKVTDVSGRGVGMDVVNQNIRQLKGRIDIQSKEGFGTTFTIKIPLTLAIIQGMLLRVGTSLYTIPIESINESVKVDDRLVTSPMEDQDFVRIRNEMIPIIRLAELHDIETPVRELKDGVLVIVEGRQQKVALFVDELEGQQETVVKPLPLYFKNVPGVSGCSIMGNGEVCLILDSGMIVEYLLSKNKSMSRDAAV